MILPTLYKGITYRSRTEARWSVFMDKMGCNAQYEMEGFDLGDGLFYLPDFYLPFQDSWLEIKGPIATKTEKQKASRLSEVTDKRVFLIEGPPCPEWTNWKFNLPGATLFYFGEDYHYLWCECPHCGRCELQFDGRADRTDCKCPKSEHGDKGYNYDTPRLCAAIYAAISERFGT